MKKIFIIITVFITVICSCEETIVTDRYLITYTPSVKLYSDRADVYSTPSVTCKRIGYADDSTAVKREKTDVQQRREKISKGLNDAMEKYLDDKTLENMMKLNAYRELDSEEAYILSLSHKKDFDTKRFLKSITSGFSVDKTMDIADKEGVTVMIYPL